MLPRTIEHFFSKNRHFHIRQQNIIIVLNLKIYYVDNEEDGIHFFCNRQLPILCVHGFGICGWFGGSARHLSVNILEKHRFSSFLRIICSKQDMKQW